MMKHRRILNISLFIITAVIISLIVPSYGTFNYNFKLGQEWEGDNITAVFDFPIYKTTEQYDKDIQKITANYVPIYNIDTTISNNVLNQIYTKYELADKPNQKGTLIYDAFSKILAIGIIDTTNNFGKNNIIKLISDGQIRSITTHNLYTQSKAVEEITTLLTNDSLLTEIDAYQINDMAIPNIFYNNQINKINKDTEINKASKTKGFIPSGTTLLNKGEIIDINAISTLNSYKNEFQKRELNGSGLSAYIGYLLYALIIMILSYVTLGNFRIKVMGELKNVLFILILYLASIIVLASFTENYGDYIYIIPFIIAPLYISAFYNTKMAIHQYIYILLICSLLTPKPIEFIAINFFGGVVAVLIIKSRYRRQSIVWAVCGAFVTYGITYLAISLLSQDMSNFNYYNILWFFANAMFAMVLYQLLFVIEKTFGFVTKITLYDLCDTNRPLLKLLATTAPGTFQHSIQVANLCEKAAKDINANHFLARAGALYHDIGKMENSAMFIENNVLTSQPHKDLTPKESAAIIKNHVSDGVVLAKKHGLPNVLVEFIESHHSDSLIYYFYRKELDNSEIDIVDILDFQYPGPKPVSKEATICMICDSVEAASRSLEQYNDETIQKLIDDIISNQIKDGLMNDSMLEISEIKIIKKSLTNSLVNIYHSRIAYPKR